MNTETVQVPDAPEPTLRDKFAMAAMPTLLHHGRPTSANFPRQTLSMVARTAYMLADVMLEARKE